MPNKMFVSCEIKEINEFVKEDGKTERTIVAWASRPVIDRDNEIINWNAWDTKEFEKNRVLMLGHNYSQPPIGKVMWTRKSRQGLRFMARFANTPIALEIFELYKDDVMRAFSVGFIPKKWEDNNDDSDKGKGKKKPDRVYTKVELLEISCVSIPSCPDALMIAYDNGSIKTKELSEELEFIKACKTSDNKESDTKGAIPYHDYGKADENASWDAGKEVKAADVDDLKKMCSWFKDDGENKTDYKLPHHRQDDKKCVWRAVANASARLPQSQIPVDDKKKVQTHLGKHYKQFDKEPPWEKSIELWDDYCELSESMEEAINSLELSHEKRKELTEAIFGDNVNEYYIGIEKIFDEETEMKAVIIDKPGWDETETSFRRRVRNPNLFIDDTMRTVPIKKTKPRVTSVMGKLKKDGTDGSMTIQTLIFPKGDDWTLDKAKAWLTKHEELLKAYMAVFNELYGAYMEKDYDEDDAFTLAALYIDHAIETKASYKSEICVDIRKMLADMEFIVSIDTKSEPDPVNVTDREGLKDIINDMIEDKITLTSKDDLKTVFDSAAQKAEDELKEVSDYEIEKLRKEGKVQI